MQGQSKHKTTLEDFAYLWPQLLGQLNIVQKQQEKQFKSNIKAKELALSPKRLARNKRRSARKIEWKTYNEEQ